MQWHVYETAIQLIQALRPVVAKLATQDPKLSDQIRGAASSVTANLNEGRRRTGKDRMQLWRIAHGSADEVRGHLDTAEAWGYFDADLTMPARVLLDRVLAMLYRMLHPR